MSDDTRHWSSYTTPPERSLEMFEQNRQKCPIPHSDEHEGFYMLLNYVGLPRFGGRVVERICCCVDRTPWFGFMDFVSRVNT